MKWGTGESVFSVYKAVEERFLMMTGSCFDVSSIVSYIHAKVYTKVYSLH